MVFVGAIITVIIVCWQCVCEREKESEGKGTATQVYVRPSQVHGLPASPVEKGA
jgi:hypothetical protein